jgi:hypothetical protein
MRSQSRSGTISLQLLVFSAPELGGPSEFTKTERESEMQ